MMFGKKEFEKNVNVTAFRLVKGTFELENSSQIVYLLFSLFLLIAAVMVLVFEKGMSPLAEVLTVIVLVLSSVLIFTKAKTKYRFDENIVLKESPFFGAKIMLDLNEADSLTVLNSGKDYTRVVFWKNNEWLGSISCFPSLQREVLSILKIGE